VELIMQQEREQQVAKQQQQQQQQQQQAATAAAVVAAAAAAAAAAAPPAASAPAEQTRHADQAPVKHLKSRAKTVGADAGGTGADSLVQLPPPATAATATSAATAAAAVEGPWVLPGLVVKVISRSLYGGALYKQKARVLSVVACPAAAACAGAGADPEPWAVVAPLEDVPLHAGDVSRSETGVTVRLSGDGRLLRAAAVPVSRLESVIPAVGSTVAVVAGRRAAPRPPLTTAGVGALSAAGALPAGATTGTLEAADLDAGRATVRLRSGEIATLGFDDICKLVD
jgi:hypothetical protein